MVVRELWLLCLSIGAVYWLCVLPAPAKCQPAPAPAPAPAPEPAPSDDLQPSDFPNEKQYKAYKVVQQFKSTVTSDPFAITATWTGPGICATYLGFYCDPPPDSPTTPTVSAIDFNGFRLAAPTLEGFIDRLPDLAFFHANSNQFAGSIPPGIANLRYFYELDLSNNLISGDIPVSPTATLGENELETNVLPLNGLTFFDIRFNRFAGNVPPQLFQLSRVFALFINNNAFDGTIPETFGSTPAQYLAISDNQFTGSLPASIAQLTPSGGGKLSELFISGNRISGCLPDTIGAFAELDVLEADRNLLTGTIPLSFGCLVKMEQLLLAGNLLYGVVPDVLCRLARTASLLKLDLADNFFTAVGPTCLQLVRTGVLDVRRNCILGFPDQKSLVECAEFFLAPEPCPISIYVPCHIPACPHCLYRPVSEMPPLPAGWKSSNKINRKN